ncbi:MAG: ribonuclease III, partial [Sneathiellales bacterium]|nr:ribonuclease III [Sneathiellales bacterium]
MAGEDTSLEKLQKALGYRFRDESLLTEALTHSSLTKGRQKAKGLKRDYDRLEFLGDRVLGLVISEELFTRFKTAEAGELSRRFNAQVRKETLAEIALEIALQEHILLSEDLASSGGRNNPSLLEDVVEALIAALYLDGGMKTARAFIEKNWWPRFDHQKAESKDPKSALQEWAAKGGNVPPVYTVIAEEGPDHNRTFTVEVTVKDFRETAKGSSKRQAEQLAA